jgi:phosphoribosylanthranilate isomerase
MNTTSDSLINSATSIAVAPIAVKICGITCYEDAVLAIDWGATALGFNFYPRSSRYISPAVAQSIARRLPPLTNLVGVFVNESQGAIQEIATSVKLGAVQLHGDESATDCQMVAETVGRVIKALRVTENFDPASVASYPVNAILLDSYSAQAFGGTGAKFDWRLANAAKVYTPYLILAGGLTPQNVVAAIKGVHPQAVDVCSGVEASPGRKDPQKLREFMLAVAQANQSLAATITDIP